MTIPKLTVTAANGVPFTVVLLRNGVSEGRPGATKYLGGKPTVEFYDARHVQGFTPDGQFVADYYTEDLLERGEGGRLVQRGLNLYGGEPAWTVDAATMGVIRGWLVRLLGPEPTPCPECGKGMLRWREGQPDGNTIPAAMCLDEACGYEY